MLPMIHNSDSVARFATYVATLGRGPGRSRALTRAEAADAMAMLLAGTPDPMQVGAFLMLLRYRGEDPQEIAGLVEAAHAACALPGTRVDLDWPSYGAGRTRGAPWFLLAALALAASGVRVLMHGSNEFSGGMTVPQALERLGLAQAASGDAAGEMLERQNFAYLPLASLCPPMADLLGLRRLFGLRSPVNTVARLLDPAGASAGVDGVFHPPYIETHLATAELLGRPRLLVLKGGGGEAERNPARPVAAHLWVRGQGREALALPALEGLAATDAQEPDLAAVWRGTVQAPGIEARVVGTIALGLLALGRGGDAEARAVWQARLGGGVGLGLTYDAAAKRFRSGVPA
jgi:anthranilate phosphoribosyltransferase